MEMGCNIFDNEKDCFVLLRFEKVQAQMGVDRGRIQVTKQGAELVYILKKKKKEPRKTRETMRTRRKGMY